MDHPPRATVYLLQNTVHLPALMDLLRLPTALQMAMVITVTDIMATDITAMAIMEMDITAMDIMETAITVTVRMEMVKLALVATATETMDIPTAMATQALQP